MHDTRRTMLLLAAALGGACSPDNGSGASLDGSGSTSTSTTGSTSTTSTTSSDASGPGTTEPTTGLATGSGSDSDATTGTSTGTVEPTTGISTSTGAPPVCGDAVVDPGEECDDGPANSDTGTCTSACKLATCGDGLVQAGVEECDDANADDADTCVAGCKQAACGDGFVGPGEGCDDGNQVDDDACSNACAAASCGDGVVQNGEACDDGDADDSDACLSTCVAASCGDGVVQVGVEDCDDGNADETDACTASCEPPACDDAAKNGDESDVDCGGSCGPCDAGAACGSGADCESGVCTMQVCAILASCKAILAADPNAPSGVYPIDPDGDGMKPAFDVYCDMTADGGGWTYGMIVNTNTTSQNRGRLAGYTVFGTPAPPSPATEFGVDLTGIQFTEVRIDNFTSAKSVKHATGAPIVWSDKKYVGNTGFQGMRFGLADNFELRAGYYGNAAGCENLNLVNIPVCFTKSNNPVGWICDTDNGLVEGMMDCTAGELCGNGFYYGKKVWRDTACVAYVNANPPAVYGFAVR